MRPKAIKISEDIDIKQLDLTVISQTWHSKHMLKCKIGYIGLHQC